MPLNYLSPGESGRIVGIGGSGKVRSRLLELGFIEGTEVAVLQSLSRSLIVKVKNSSVGLDSSLCRRIEVEVLK